ncbi:MAG: DUF1893 domain-containing protein [Clostridiales bacterium]|jgi:hypothetical protein|nr:DUF1893 domain-containing protein [Clostridiales bacterium]
MTARESFIREINAGNVSCIFSLSDGTERRGFGRGIAPLAELYIQHKDDLIGAECYDKAIGSAAAALLADIGVRSVYGAVMSEGALNALNAVGIEAAYGSLVPVILNGKRRELCALEARVLGLDQSRAVAETLAFCRERGGI